MLRVMRQREGEHSKTYVGNDELCGPNHSAGLLANGAHANEAVGAVVGNDQLDVAGVDRRDECPIDKVERINADLDGNTLRQRRRLRLSARRQYREENTLAIGRNTYSSRRKPPRALGT